MPKKKLTPAQFKRLQEKLVVKAVLMELNLKLDKSKTIDVTIRGLGTIHTHGNCKEAGHKYRKDYQKERNKEVRKKREFSEKHLLF